MSTNIFQSCIIYILPSGLLKKRIKLFEDKILAFGGKITSEPLKTPPTHIIVEDGLLNNPSQVINALKATNLLPESLNCKIIGTLWLSRCLKEKQFLNTDNFEFKKITLVKNELNDECQESPAKKRRIEVYPGMSVSKTINFDVPQIDHCPNEVILNEFQKLADSYRARRDKWRTLGYEKAIQSIKSCKREITNINDVKGLPNISAKMVDKIAEILENGYLTKARELYTDEKTKILDMFGKIWGAGPTTAELWYQKGLRTFEDLETKGNLNQQQKIGLKYYNDIQEKIPREEVAEIVKIVTEACMRVCPNLKVIPCGSFRRGKQICGDVDVLVIKKDHIKYDAVLPKIITNLKSTGFIVDDLIGTDNSEEPRKYLGLCKLPRENAKNRRLDVFLVPENESATAIMHYTGSGLFNRAIRLYASKKNMHLSEHGLYRIIHQDKEILRKHQIQTPNEESIFQHLGLSYRLPEDREVFST
ncbi:DNA polymerase lambda-like [Planococcus citri]|uniref:DNA polymerase lambda-like n=1 Tax=Planococcus citri TaxID=170843 RepID=UPI0031FA1018